MASGQRPQRWQASRNQTPWTTRRAVEATAGEQRSLSRTNSAAAAALFRFPPPAERRRNASLRPAQSSPALNARAESPDRTPRSALDLREMTQQLQQLETTSTTTEPTEPTEPAEPAETAPPVAVPFEVANVLFIVNGGTPQHKGFKNSVHQMLLRRGVSSRAPEVTRMVFFSEPFNQYVVQEVRTTNGEIQCEVADRFSGFGHSRLLQLQRGVDMMVIFTNRSTISSAAQRQLLGIERIRSHGLQNIPHIIIMVNEGANTPSPKEAFAAVRRLSNLPNIAILYQAIPSRESLGPCHILHLEGFLQHLWPEGIFDGRTYLTDRTEWRDLPDLELGSAMERLVLDRNLLQATAPSDRPSTRVRAATDAPSSLALDLTFQNADSTARRVRRISQLLISPTRDASALSRLQRELRLEHRRNSQRRESPIIESIPSGPARISNSFTGECPICCEENSQLAFLLKQSSPFVPEDPTPRWPFSLGPDPANDIISAFLCCDNCSFYVVEDGRTPLRERCTGAFALIPYRGITNSARWKDDLAKGLSHYSSSSRDLLPLVFLAIVDFTLRTKTWAQPDGSLENEIRRNALLWAKKEILENVHMTGNGHSGYLGAWISAVVTKPQKGWGGSIIWNYPVSGFVLLLRLASPTPPAAAAKILHKRLLLDILRRFRAVPDQLDFSLVLRLNEMLLSPDVAEDEWLAYAAAEGVLDDELWEAVAGVGHGGCG
ncbi:hypothetical protein FN846DRAFT_199606 [Sphaerosporella brunnea]|uniref:Uncharacterized protein n=1 Tax=Sphaerosporella brunnea TaxID=1250544 RepID=A0A5J5EN71_9PEZI|nr:hypothetical protein FN846DRAFT_199606 [Sphaerosporella brunnea]